MNGGAHYVDCVLTYVVVSLGGVGRSGVGSRGGVGRLVRLGGDDGNQSGDDEDLYEKTPLDFNAKLFTSRVPTFMLSLLGYQTTDALPPRTRPFLYRRSAFKIERPRIRSILASAALPFTRKTHVLASEAAPPIFPRPTLAFHLTVSLMPGRETIGILEPAFDSCYNKRRNI